LECKNTDQVRGQLTQVLVTPVKQKPSIDLSLVTDQPEKSADMLQALINAYRQ
jgi:hypothetical protein